MRYDLAFRPHHSLTGCGILVRHDEWIGNINLNTAYMGIRGEAIPKSKKIQNDILSCYRDPAKPENRIRTLSLFFTVTR
jgi:hypothetical protein